MPDPTRVPLNLGGTGEDNRDRINVHPDFQRVSIGSSASPQSNLHVFGDVRFTNPYTEIRTDTFAGVGSFIAANTSVSNLTVTIDTANAFPGAEWRFSDLNGTWPVRSLAVVTNGALFDGGANRLLCDQTIRFALVYANNNVHIRL